MSEQRRKRTRTIRKTALLVRTWLISATSPGKQNSGATLVTIPKKVKSGKY
jgi:hypothetical protein